MGLKQKQWVDLASYFTGVGDIPDSALSLALVSVSTIFCSNFSKETLLMTQTVWQFQLTQIFCKINDTDSTPTGYPEVILVILRYE